MKKVLFYGIFIILCYTFVEACLRVFQFFQPVPILFDTSYNRYRGQPHSDCFGHTLNQGGFKDLEFGPKPPGHLRIVGIGDSFAFGTVPYPDNFLTLAEQLLNQETPGRPVEIYNMGISGTGPPEQLSLLATEGFNWQPDIVLMLFFTGNDFQESVLSSRKRWFQTYSYTGTALYSIYRLLTKTNANFPLHYYGSQATYCDSCTTMKPDDYLALQESRSFVFESGNPEFEKRLEDALYHLSRIQQVCKLNRVPLVVGIIPDESQINPELRQQVIERLQRVKPSARWDNTQPNTRLAEALQQAGVPVIDFYPAIRQGQQDSSCYMKNDTHWNRHGNRVAAGYLAQQLSPLLKKTTQP